MASTLIVSPAVAGSNAAIPKRSRSSRTRAVVQDSPLADLQRIRFIEPGNEFANRHLDSIARFFADRARDAFVAGDVDGGTRALEQGLIVDPRHRDLLRLRQDVLARMGEES